MIDSGCGEGRRIRGTGPGGRANLSRSTVHRYCKGVTFPASFGAVEKIASVCGADQRELSRLYRFWEQAQLPATEMKPKILAAQPLPSAKRPRPLLRLSVVLAALLLAVVEHPTRRSRSGVRQERSAVDEPQRGVYDRPNLDRHVEPAERAGIPLLFTLNGTPGWASPDGPKMNFSERPRTSAPDDLAVWENYVRTVATRYRGRIQAYELWDAANVEAGYSGTVETMVELTARAGRAIKESDPNALVVCPGTAELWDPAALAWLERFARLDGYSHCDVEAGDGRELRRPLLPGRPLRRVPEGLLLQLGQRPAPDHVAAARRNSGSGGPIAPPGLVAAHTLDRER